MEQPDGYAVWLLRTFNPRAKESDDTYGQKQDEYAGLIAMWA
jgi:hypothetical protein